MIAYAVVREDPPIILLADDIDTLQRLVALRVVAQTPPSEFSTPEAVDRIRQALLDEEWGSAVEQWIDLTGIAVDVYGDGEVVADARLTSEMVGVELQFTPLFTT